VRPDAEEIFLEHVVPRARVSMASQVRGTVLLSSLRGLRAHGQHERYMDLLETRYRDDIASLTAPTWFPLDLARAHYDACERLDLDKPTIEAIGAEAGAFTSQTVLNVVVKLSKTSGVSPWFALSNSNKLVARTWMGSSIAIYKLGPKEARLEWIQQPMARFPYFRTAFGAFASAISANFAQMMFVRELAKSSTDTEVSYRVSWV
jgi:hypothetical protein